MKITEAVIKFCSEEIIEFCLKHKASPITDECGCKYYEIHNYSVINDIGQAYVHRCDKHGILFRKFLSNVKVGEPRVIILGNPERKCRIYDEYMSAKKKNVKTNPILFRKFKL